MSWAYQPLLPSAAALLSGIKFDTTSNGGFVVADDAYTWSHTCSGSDRYLVIGIVTLAGQTVSSLTYNGVALSLIRGVTNTVRVELWGLVNPAIGTNTISLTLSGVATSIGIASSFTGVHQTSPVEGDNSATGTGTADATVDITSVANNDWAVDIVGISVDTTIIVGAGQTQRANVSGAGGAGGMSTEGPKTPAGAITMSWTDMGNLNPWAIAGVALRPVEAANISTGGDFYGNMFLSSIFHTHILANAL